MCSISTALDSAIQADQTYDQSILDAASLEIKNNINYDKFGVRGLVRLLQLIYARCTSSGQWHPKNYPASWHLPQFDSNRFGVTTRPSKSLKSFYSSTDDSLDAFGSLDAFNADLSDDHFFHEQDTQFILHNLSVDSVNDVDISSLHDACASVLETMTTTFSLTPLTLSTTTRITSTGCSSRRC